MHVVVVGAGIIGVTSAYYLRQRGCAVTVLERRSGVAQECSFANAGVIAPAYAAPWAQPGMPAKVLSTWWHAEAPIVFRPTLDPALWRWLARWWRECARERFQRNKARMQRLAAYSRGELATLAARHAIDYEAGTGYLQLFRTEAEIERGAPAREVLRAAGVAHTLLDAAGARRLEPALAEASALAGALYLPDDGTGNCAYFARRLRDIAAQAGVEFRCGVAVTALLRDGDRITGVHTAAGVVAADAVVVAAGVDSTALLAPLGIRVPLYPVKGYSATATIVRPEHAPLLSVMDESYKVAVTRLGNRLRIAGTAEIGTRRLQLRQSALRTLMKVARDWFPQAADYRQASWWVGARPMLPDGPPLLGDTGLRGLFLNLGHGSSGWAMACGSAAVVADVVTGTTPAIDLEGLTLARYGAAG